MLDAKLNAKATDVATNHPQAVSRFDPITGKQTIFAPGREQRPNDFLIQQTDNNDAADCPFCAGAESCTPNPVWIGRKTDADLSDATPLVDSGMLLGGTQCIDDPDLLADLPQDDWAVRVVPNRYPAVNPPPENSIPVGRSAASSLFAEKVVHGGHEVIVESPQHSNSLAKLDLSNVALVFAAYRDRIRHWSENGRSKYVVVFKNCGAEAGASLLHSHSQLVASDMMPAATKDTLRRMNQHRAQTGCCLQCDLVRAELKDPVRVIAKTNSLIAFCPFASRMPMTIRITTTEHADRYDQLSDQTIESIAHLVKRADAWIDKLRPSSAYNFVLHTRPPGAQDKDSFHWYLDIFPRMTRMAGFEFGSDCIINPVMPELAAMQYRQCAKAEDPRWVL